MISLAVQEVSKRLTILISKEDPAVKILVDYWERIFSGK